MIVPIGADWRLRSDPLQWILERRDGKSRNPCSPRWRAQGYFCDPLLAVQRCLDAQVRLSEGQVSSDALIAFQTRVDGLLADARLALDAIVADEKRRRTETPLPPAAAGAPERERRAERGIDTEASYGEQA